VPVALAVLENLVELAVQEVLGAPGNQAGPVALVVPAVLVVLENPAARVELIAPVEAVLVHDHRLVLLAVALRTRSVIAAHHPDQVRLLAVEEDLAAAVAEITPDPAVAEAAIAWAVAGIAAAVVAAGTVAAVAAEVAVGAEAVVVVAEVDEDKTTVHEEKTNEIKNIYYDFVENSRDRLRDS